MSYLGNCVNAFDADGECVVDALGYSDASAFTCALEEAVVVDREVFFGYVKASRFTEQILKSCDTFFVDLPRNLFIAYSFTNDVHHFYSSDRKFPAPCAARAESPKF